MRHPLVSPLAQSLLLLTLIAAASAFAPLAALSPLRRASLAHLKGLMLAVHGLEHLDMAASFFTLAVVHFLRGEYEKALELYQKSLDIMIRVRGRDNTVYPKP
ncbi:hypothetical protein T484DRAFT_1800124 [Baffinella frigidus]|nr:hypothetical protein T484DRAFT_1800124 [Cryptophyta sp. CCMP2293]